MAFPGIWLTPGATVSLQGSYSSVKKTHWPVTRTFGTLENGIT